MTTKEDITVSDSDVILMMAMYRMTQSIFILVRTAQ